MSCPVGRATRIEPPLAAVVSGTATVAAMSSPFVACERARPRPRLPNSSDRISGSIEPLSAENPPPPKSKLKLRKSGPPACRPNPKSFELRRARLAFGVDFPAIKSAALLLVAENFVSRADFREAFLRPRLLALVGVVFLGELTKCGLDFGRARRLRHSKNVIRIAHHEPILRPSPHAKRENQCLPVYVGRHRAPHKGGGPATDPLGPLDRRRRFAYSASTGRPCRPRPSRSSTAGSTRRTPVRSVRAAVPSTNSRKGRPRPGWRRRRASCAETGGSQSDWPNNARADIIRAAVPMSEDQDRLE